MPRVHAELARCGPADLGDLERAEQVALEAWDAFGGLDVLVNNAAIPKRTRVTDLTPHDVEYVMDVDFHSPVRMGLAVLPRMIERGSGQIMFVSSMGGRIPIVNEAAYNAAKYAMCGFAEAMLLDLAGTGVEVKLVLPGPIATEIWDQPDNVPALMDVDKVPAAGVRGRASPTRSKTAASSTTSRRCSRVASTRRRSRSARRSTATSTCGAWPTSPRPCANRARAMRDRREVRDNKQRFRYEIVDGRRGRRLRAVQHARRPHPPRAHRDRRGVRRAGTARRNSYEAALDDIRERGLYVVPVCPFVERFIERHPEYDDLVDHEMFDALNAERT